MAGPAAAASILLLLLASTSVAADVICRSSFWPLPRCERRAWRLLPLFHRRRRHCQLPAARCRVCCLRLPLGMCVGIPTTPGRTSISMGRMLPTFSAKGTATSRWCTHGCHACLAAASCHSSRPHPISHSAAMCRVVGSSQAGSVLPVAASAWPQGAWTQQNATRSLLPSSAGKQCWGRSCSMYKIIECPPPGKQPCLPGPRGNIGFNNSGYNSIGVGIVGSQNFGCFVQGEQEGCCFACWLDMWT